jgi:hypothetical protein
MAAPADSMTWNGITREEVTCEGGEGHPRARTQARTAPRSPEWWRCPACCDAGEVYCYTRNAPLPLHARVARRSGAVTHLKTSQDSSMTAGMVVLSSSVTLVMDVYW